MSKATLNLARKWRPQSFDQVVGQDVAVSMLRNSLYKNHFFPVYLFAGQRGCGKTSSARIFAAAANCENLVSFQKDPSKQTLPCLTCDSCTHMINGTHPDFIEIDAASHTGVDDVRALLESCSFMPLMGNKKLYLIDEAHMLSKAAFNALLKVLEEPPDTVIFMLATTELEKIPDTVHSRCFNLSFSSLDTAALHSHLKTICEKESIAFDDDALSLIINETSGSARDALNLLEQVRFSGEQVSADDVRKALGMLSPIKLAHVIIAMLEKKADKVFELLEKYSFKKLAAQRLWGLTLTMIRELIWQTYGITKGATLADLPEEERAILKQLGSRNRLHAIMQLMWNQELIFLSTPYKHQFIETVFLQVCEQVNISELSELKALLASPQARVQAAPSRAPLPPSRAPQTAPQPQPPATPRAEHASQPAQAGKTSAWQSFVAAIGTLNDPILHSIFAQAQYENTNAPNVAIRLKQASSFFTDKITEHKEAWRPLLAKYFPGCSNLTYTAAGGPPKRPARVATTARAPLPSEIKRPAPQQAPAQKQFYQGPKRQKAQLTPQLQKRLPQGASLTLTEQNEAEWPQAALISSHFPGKLEIIT